MDWENVYEAGKCIWTWEMYMTGKMHMEQEKAYGLENAYGLGGMQIERENLCRL